MRAGRLRHRLILQSRGETRNSYGESEPVWVTQATVWGAIEPLSGREWFAQQQVQSEVSVRIVIRYNSQINTNWRVKHGTNYYDIESVIQHNKRTHMMTLMCRQGESEDIGADVYSLLLENGDNVLLENGSNLILE